GADACLLLGFAQGALACRLVLVPPPSAGDAPRAAEVAPRSAQLQPHAPIRVREQQPGGPQAAPDPPLRAGDPRAPPPPRTAGARIVGCPGHAASLCRAPRPGLGCDLM